MAMWLREGVVENGDVSRGENHIPGVELVKVPAGQVYRVDYIWIECSPQHSVHSWKVEIFTFICLQL